MLVADRLSLTIALRNGINAHIKRLNTNEVIVSSEEFNNSNYRWMLFSMRKADRYQMRVSTLNEHEFIHGFETKMLLKVCIYCPFYKSYLLVLRYK